MGENLGGRATPETLSVDGSGLRIAIISARFNAEVVDRLTAGARAVLEQFGVGTITELVVPGAWEIPIAAAVLARRGEVDAIVAVGTVIRGDTYHFEIVADQSAAGLMQVAVNTGVVVTNAILTVDNPQQAFDRAGGALGDKGAEAASAALEMLSLLARGT